MIKVHYEGWNTKHDEWLCSDSWRICESSRLLVEKFASENHIGVRQGFLLDLKSCLKSKEYHHL